MFDSSTLVCKMLDPLMEEAGTMDRMGGGESFGKSIGKLSWLEGSGSIGEQPRDGRLEEICVVPT
jgi:hypothetical protein